MAIVISALRDSAAQTTEYLKLLAQWHHNEWLHLNPGATLEQRIVRYQKSIQSTVLPEIFIASHDHKLLGSVTLDKDDMDTRQYLTPWLASLYVEPDSRGLGIGSGLIQYCVDYAKQLDYKNLYLFTEEQTQFYQQRGFRFVETLEYRQVEVDLMYQNLKTQEEKDNGG